MKRPRSRRSLPWIGGALIAAAVGAAVLHGWRAYQQAVGDAGRELDTQARIVAEQSARTLQAVDLVLRNLAQQQRDGQLQRLDDEALYRLLREQARGLVQIEGLLVAGPDGRMKAVSMGYPLAPGAPNLSQFRLFRQMPAEPPGQLLIGNAGLSPVDNLWVFLIARRLEAVDGGFAGIAAARGRVDYFQTFWRDIQLEPGTRVALVHRSGSLLAQHPGPGALGKPSALRALLGDPHADRIAPRRLVDPTDGSDRFAAIQPVPDYPLAVVVTRDAATALAGWRDAAVGTAWRTAILAAMGAVLLVMLMRQLTRLEIARHSVETAQERFALAVAGSDDGIWDWDQASDRIYASPRAREILGMPPAVEAQKASDWYATLRVHPQDEPRRRAALEEHLAGRAPAYEAEFRVLDDDGSERWVRLRGVCVRDRDGVPRRMAGSVSDIDARKRAEGQLRQAQKLEALGTLAGGIAHDFNNILAAILGYGEMAQRGAPPGTPMRRNLDAVMNAGLRAKSLVERILAFSRSGVGERVPVHVGAVVSETLDLVRASLPHALQLHSRLDAGDAAVLGDPTQIHQVVMNLCANAVQATKAGSITVATDAVALEAARVVATSTLPPGRYVRITVEDTGTGIAPDVLERAFDPFFTTKEVGVGTGLGLSLVHGIATDLGGGIAVESTPGVGSAFSVFLPWHADMALQAGDDEPVENGHGQTVMLVDDEEPLVRLGEEMLAQLGYEPVGFTSGQAALQAFRDEPGRFQAVLTDESMPGMTGSELLRRLLALQPGLPVVLMSGDVTPQLAAHAREAGAAQVLNKPLVSRDIARSLREVLSGFNSRLDGPPAL
jgi:PAS domain S-box-containing protein